MAIWVSRYSNKELRNGKYYPVGISLGAPKWPLGYEIRQQCYALAPKGYMMNYEPEQFRKAYFGKLEAIGTSKVIGIVKHLESEAKREGKELVLLCYEDIRVPGQWCHRTTFSEWWEKQLGEKIEELPDPTPAKGTKPEKKEEAKAKEPQYQQMSLFDL